MKNTFHGKECARLFAVCAVSILFVVPAAVVAQSSAAAGSDDLVLRAMSAEMERSKTSLKLDKEKAPYFIEYAITDQDNYVAEATFGALRVDQRVHNRIVRVLVRVGDYKQDNVMGQNESVVELAALDDDLLALRQQIWLTTDTAYKRALQQLTDKQARLKQFESDQQADDFAHAPEYHHIDAPVKITVDMEQWKHNVEAASALYRSDPKLQAFACTFQATAINRYFMNSEGSWTRSGKSMYTYNISGSTQAADGMRLDRSQGHAVAAAAELPTADNLKAEAKAVMDTLAALREAPIVEEQYRGPVLFSADAASDVFSGLIADNILGKRPNPGQTSRTTGAFANDFKSRVLPEFVSVVDDPTRETAAGRALAGSYLVDDEAVKATPVTVVDKGILVNYLTSRQPVRDFPQSNGHGRATSFSSAQPGVGNLFVTSSEPLSKEKLQQKFLETCKNHDLKYCYRVETMANRLTPRLLYRVFVADGHEELVRGAKFDQLDTRAMRSDLAALGDDAQAFNQPGQYSSTIIVPSLFFGELEVMRANSGKEKLPQYPAPELVGK